jgi:hypothetical protein
MAVRKERAMKPNKTTPTGRVFTHSSSRSGHHDQIGHCRNGPFVFSRAVTVVVHVTSTTRRIGIEVEPESVWLEGADF